MVIFYYFSKTVRVISSKVILLLIYTVYTTAVNSQIPVQILISPHFSTPLKFENDKNTLQAFPAFCGYIGIRKTFIRPSQNYGLQLAAALGTTAHNYRFLTKKDDFPFLPEDKFNFPTRIFLIPYFQLGAGITHLITFDAIRPIKLNAQVGLRFYASYIGESGYTYNVTNPPNGQQAQLFKMIEETRTSPRPYFMLQLEKKLTRVDSRWNIEAGIELCYLPFEMLYGEFSFFPGTVNSFSGSVSQTGSSFGIFFSFGKNTPAPAPQ
ncbi:MAG: hypothetical protein ACRC3B_07285 [Bacteroidia bacterium]